MGLLFPPPYAQFSHQRFSDFLPRKVFKAGGPKWATAEPRVAPSGATGPAEMIRLKNMKVSEPAGPWIASKAWPRGARGNPFLFCELPICKKGSVAAFPPSTPRASMNIHPKWEGVSSARIFFSNSARRGIARQGGGRKKQRHVNMHSPGTRVMVPNRARHPPRKLTERHIGGLRGPQITLRDATGASDDGNVKWRAERFEEPRLTESCHRIAAPHGQRQTLKHTRGILHCKHGFFSCSAE